MKIAISIAMEDSTLQLSPRQIMQKKASTTMGCGMQLVSFLYFYLTSSAYVALFCGLPLEAKRMPRPLKCSTLGFQTEKLIKFWFQTDKQTDGQTEKACCGPSSSKNLVRNILLFVSVSFIKSWKMGKSGGVAHFRGNLF